MCLTDQQRHFNNAQYCPAGEKIYFTPLHHQQQPESLTEGVIDPCFHVLNPKLCTYHLNVAADTRTNHTRLFFFFGCMVVRKNISRSAVYETFRSAGLPPATTSYSKWIKSASFRSLMLSLNLIKLLDHVYMRLAICINKHCEQVNDLSLSLTSLFL